MAARTLLFTIRRDVPRRLSTRPIRITRETSMTPKNTLAGIAGAVVAVALTAACSDRAESKVDAAAKDTANAAERAGNATAEAAKDAGNAARDAGRAAGNAVIEGGKAADAAVETMDVKVALSTDAR